MMPHPPQPATLEEPLALPPHHATAAQRLSEGLNLARKLSDEQAISAGMKLLHELCSEFPLEVEPNILTVLLAREGGQPQQALHAARRACFLAPDQPITHFLMSVCLEDIGEPHRAQLHLQTTSTLLASIIDRKSLLRYGEGLTVNQLQRMIDGIKAGP